jgi:hypothetical protein
MPATGVAQGDIEQIDLADDRGANLATQRIGQQLVSETDAEERLVALGHPSADRGLLVPQPSETVLLPDVHGTAHRHEDVVAIEIGDRRAAVELHDRRRDAVGHEVAGDRPRMAIGCVLEDENPWKHQDPSTVERSISRQEIPILRVGCLQAPFSKRSLGEFPRVADHGQESDGEFH